MSKLAFLFLFALEISCYCKHLLTMNNISVKIQKNGKWATIVQVISFFPFTGYQTLFVPRGYSLKYYLNTSFYLTFYGI